MQHLNLSFLKGISLLLGLCSLAAPAAAQVLGAPQLRVQAEQRGDFLLFGNTVGFDCRNGVPNPIVGTVDGTACGTNTDDTAVDVFWRADEPAAGQASITLTAAEARSTAVLQLPDGASVTYARLYWSGGLRGGSLAGANALIERVGQGAFTQAVTADASYTADSGANGPGLVYQSTADITRLVQRQGAGPYRVGGLATIELANQDLEVTQIVWSVVVFYRRDADPPRNLAIFEGLAQVTMATPANALLAGFVVPQMDYDAKLGVIAYEGDFDATGDFIQVNDKKLSNGMNPEDNFFNATRSVLGQAVTVAGDLPQMNGLAGSMNGYDLDVVDIRDLLKPGESRATLSARTVNDIYYLGAFVTSVGTFKPLFNDTTLSVKDKGGAATFVAGARVEYTIETKNSGNDDGTGAFVDVQLPPGVTYEPGTLVIVSGEGAGAKTDFIGDDQGEYFPGTAVVRVRLGKGATGKVGGTVSPNDAPTIIKFCARIDDAAKGKLTTQAIVTAAGQQGTALGIAPYRFFSTNTTQAGTGGVGGAGSPTVIIVAECDGNAQCQGRPRGSICTTDKVCGCQTSADCPAPSTCDLQGGQCVLLPSDIQVKVTTAPIDGKPVGLDPVKYTVEVTNAGPGTAPGARVVVTLPPGAMVEGLTPGDGWDCRTIEGEQKAPELPKEPTRIECTRKTSLAPGQKAPEIIFSVSPGPMPGAVITIEGAATGPAGGPAAGDFIVITDPDIRNNIVVLDLDGGVSFRAGGGGFGCVVALGGERGAGAAALCALLLALVLMRRRRP